MKDKIKAQEIRELNDTFRQTFKGGRVVTTLVVDALGGEAKAKVIAAVQGFTNFHKANDPHHEHDFGSFTVDGGFYCWKIDYYDLAMSQHSLDATNPDATIRVLTIMCADEY